MTLLQVVVLALAQGLAAFWPVSAGAHLHLLPTFFDWHFYGSASQDPGAAFTAAVRLGGMCALLAYFWRELLHVSVAWCRGLYDAGVRHSLEYRLGWYLLAVTIPAVVLGIVFDGRIRRGYDDRWLLAGALVVVGLALWACDRFRRRSRVEEQFGPYDAAALALAQVLALIPGVSRAGAALVATRAGGFDRETAVRFAFLSSIPSVVVLTVFSAVRVDSRHQPSPGTGLVGFGAVVAFAGGLVALHLLLRWVRSHTLGGFAWYRMALGLAVIGLIAGGVWEASA